MLPTDAAEDEDGEEMEMDGWMVWPSERGAVEVDGYLSSGD